MENHTDAKGINMMRKRQIQNLMTQDEIIEMYLQVSKELCSETEWCWAGVGEPLQMFAKLIAAKEREACANICEEKHYLAVADAIMARGQA